MRKVYAVQHQHTGRFLGRGRGWSREWVEHIENADLWDRRGPGFRAVQERGGRWNKDPSILDKVRYVEVRLEVLP